MATEPKHSPAPWVYDPGRCAIRYQLPEGHPERWSNDPEEDDGWRNVVNLQSACGGTNTTADVMVMTAAPQLLAELKACEDALLAAIPHAPRIRDVLQPRLEAVRAAIAAAETAP